PLHHRGVVQALNFAVQVVDLHAAVERQRILIGVALGLAGPDQTQTNQPMSRHRGTSSEGPILVNFPLSLSQHKSALFTTDRVGLLGFSPTPHCRAVSSNLSDREARQTRHRLRRAPVADASGSSRQRPPEDEPEASATVPRNTQEIPESRSSL